MSRTNKGQPNREKRLFGWTATYCNDGRYGITKAGIVWATTRNMAGDRVHEDYPKDKWMVSVTWELEGDLVVIFDES